MAEENTGSDGTGDDTGNEETGQTDDQNTSGGDDDLETWKANARKWERNAKANADAQAKLAAAEKRLRELDTSKSDHEKQLDIAREEAAANARLEALQKANARILKSEVRAAAGGKLADPEDAVRFLDLDTFDVSEDGEVDAKAIASAVDRLLKEKPYLSADAGMKRFGDANQGARGKPGAGGTSMNDLIRQKAGRS